MDRLSFLKSALAAGGAAIQTSVLRAFDVVSVQSPLGMYLSRGWEQIYRDQYHYD